jgi:hypothetical protein
VTLAGEGAAERIDGGGLAYAWRAGDADANGIAGEGEQILYELARQSLMVASAALDESDAARDHRTLPGANAVNQSRNIRECGAAARRHEDQVHRT